MNVEIIICIYFRHMQVDISKFSLLPRLFHWIKKCIGCINSLIAGASAPFLFSFPFIFLFIHWMRRLMAANAWRRANKLGNLVEKYYFGRSENSGREGSWVLGLHMAKLSTYNLSTLLSFEYAAVLLSKKYGNIHHDATFPCHPLRFCSRMKKHLNSYYLKK